MKNTKMPRMVFSYVHHNKQSASVVSLHCKTDFALRTDIIATLGKQLAMQLVALGKLDIDDQWIFDSSKCVKDIIQDASDLLGEPVEIGELYVT
jgi:translation elongation factor EF-Ts